MSEIRRVNIKKTMAAIERLYGDSDLCSLLGQYAEQAERAVGKRLKYPGFFRRVRAVVVPERLTDPNQIAAVLTEGRTSFSFREISLFCDYAAVWALIELDIPFRSDKELCDTVDYLKALHRIEPEELFYRLSEAERILSRTGYFPCSDRTTKDTYRRMVSEYADAFSVSEAEAAQHLSLSGPPKLKRPYASRFYFPAFAAGCLLLFLATLMLTDGSVPLSLLLLLPLSELSKTLCDALFSRIVRFTPVPKRRLDAVPAEGKTLCVITSLLTSVKDAEELSERLRNCYFANRDPNVFFGLLCDLKEADSAVCAGDEALLTAAQSTLRALNDRFGCRLYLFVRSRRYSTTEGRYMGWERKRGAVIELTRLLRGRPCSITALCGDPGLLSDIRYVITLDSDTRLYNGAVRDLVGTMLHPANHPIIKDGRVVSGYAIMQPRMEASLASAEKTPFAVLSAGSGGTDIYASAAYETYQSLFGEGIFCGKGIFDVNAFSELIDGAFPDESILSHDLLEGTRLRAAALTDLSLTDNLPKNPLSCFDRQHRWIRGDVQSLMFAGRYLPDSTGKRCRNPITSLSRFKLWDNLRRALVPLFAALSLLAAVFLPPKTAAAVLIAALSYLLFPFLLSLLLLFRYAGRRFYSFVMPGVLHAVGIFFYSLASLLHNALISADAVLRAGFRMLFSRKHMLQWKTASETEQGMSGLPLYLYRMLPSLLVGCSLTVFCPHIILKLIGLLWAFFPFAAYLMGREFPPPPRVSRSQKEEIRGYAADLWRFFSDRVTAADSSLPPDNLQLSPAEVTAHRTSPTNIGLYLLSCAAARDFGFISTAELCARLKNSLDSIDRMQKWHGHLYNWYKTGTLEILGEPYVSTVDSGNFVACLVALRSALSDHDDGTPRMVELTERITALIDDTDFAPLFDGRRKLLRIGINTATGEGGEGCYDLFMSEARTASYYAIASGQLPREHWNRLSRPLISRDGYMGLASWSGTMFEYLMPALLLPTRFGSLSYEAISFAVKEQRAAAVNGLWGRSESGYYLFDADMNYQYRAFGAPSLGIRRGLERECVLAPYATFLCLPIVPAAALENLKRLADCGMYGPYGFYEAVDFTPDRVGKGYALIRSYMAHHVGMSLIACANACFGGAFVRRFMQCPEMASSEELLEEKIPVNAVISRAAVRRRPEPPALIRDRLSRIERPDSAPSPAMPYVSVLSENGIGIVGSGDMLKLTAAPFDLTLDPFLFGEIHRPRLLFSADGRIYDALSGTMSRGAVQSRFLFRLDEKELMSEVTVSLSGKNRCFAFSLDVRGRFRTICPLFCFEPCLSTPRAREAHPAFSDLMLRAEYLEAESLLLYTKKEREENEPDLCLAVSFESHGGGEQYQTTRDLLGLMYGEKDFEKLFTLPFSAVEGAVINPFCAVRKESQSRGGRYRCNILLTVGASRSEAVSAMLSARRELRGAGGKSAAGLYSLRLRRSIEERLAVCRAQGEFARYAELLFTCAVRNRGRGGVTQPLDSLWRYGISGDLPIFCLCVRDSLPDGSPTARLIGSFISAHKYLALSGIRSDLVLLYRGGGDYADAQRAALTGLCERSASGFMTGHSGGIFFIDGEPSVFPAVSALYCEIDRNSTLDGITADCIAPLTPRPTLIQRPSVLLTHTPAPEEYPVCGGSFGKNGFTVYKGSQQVPWSYVYALPHFGTLLTQNSLGYTWIGNAHERRITPFVGDNLLDFSAERLIASSEGEDYDLCACASKVEFRRGGAVYHGSIGRFDYCVTVTISCKLPCKLITVELSEELPLDFRVSPVMGERLTAPINRVAEGDAVRFIPTLTNGARHDIGFLITKRFPGRRVYLLGAHPVGGDEVFRRVCALDEEDIRLAPAVYERKIDSMLPKLRFSFPDRALTEMANYYLPYQTLVCRFFGRTGFSQSGGAYGFRDQLQDCLSILQGAPSLVRAHLLRAAAHQYEEGDVMHWWHTIGGVSRGVRTRYSDDSLWLPYVVSEYIDFTEDRGILGISVRYLTSPLLREEEKDRYEAPAVSRYRGSLYSHCVRAIERALVFGRHGLPLMGGGDWNDGMNAVGRNGGESVWLGLFLITVLERFLPIAAAEGDLGGAAKYRAILERLRLSCEEAFDGDRYLRAYYGDGTPIGQCGSIDALPQAFAAFSGMDGDRTKTALLTAVDRLFDREHRLFRLLTPAYDKGQGKYPGYIAAYPAGVRENGGQYTHAAVWFAMGCAKAGLKKTAAELLRAVNPASLSASPSDALRYRGEPFFLAGDVCASPAFPGRCGWSLYTGAAGWYQRAVTTVLVGLKITADSFTVSPALSDAFPSFTVRFTLRDTDYTLRASLGETDRWVLDGKNVNNLFYFDKKPHLLEITVEKKADLRYNRSCEIQDRKEG